MVSGRAAALPQHSGEFGLAIELPWGVHEHKDFQKLYGNSGASAPECDHSDFAKSIQDQVDLAKIEMPAEAAYIATGGVLAMYVAGQVGNDVAQKLFRRAKEPGVPVESVIAYGNYDDFSRDQGVREASDADSTAASVPYALFGWEFFVPEDSEKSDAELLRAAAKLASRSDL